LSLKGVGLRKNLGKGKSLYSLISIPLDLNTVPSRWNLRRHFLELDVVFESVNLKA
jgi:hypothetical protein